MHNVSKTLLHRVDAFCIFYNRQRGKKFKVTGTHRLHRAVEFLERGIETCQAKHKKKK